MLGKGDVALGLMDDILAMEFKHGANHFGREFSSPIWMYVVLIAPYSKIVTRLNSPISALTESNITAISMTKARSIQRVRRQNPWSRDGRWGRVEEGYM